MPLTEEKQAEIEAVVEAMIEKSGLRDINRKFTPGGEGNPNDTRLFKSFGEQLMAGVAAAQQGATPDPRLLAINKALSESVPSDGGFLVQPDFSADLLRRTYEMGAITSRCRRIPISANANGLKINAVAETSRATGSRWGGITGYWGYEAGTKSEASPTFRQMELLLKKLYCMVYSTDELLQDTTALESVISQGCSEELNFLTEDAIINGTGAGQPLGVLNSPCLVSVAKETGQTAATVVTENIVKMWARMWAKSRPNAVWLINQDIEPQLFTMSLGVGTGGVPVYMPANGLSDKPYGQLMGRPVVPVEYCATLGTVGDIILADFSQYLLIDKGGIQAASSIHYLFVYDKTAFRFVYRVDGQPAWNAALTPFKGTNTLSPFVALAARA